MVFQLRIARFLHYDVIRTLYKESGSVREALLESIARGREHHALARNLVLPPVIASPDEVVCISPSGNPA